MILATCANIMELCGELEDDEPDAFFYEFSKEKDHDRKSSDLSEFLSVQEFKEKCKEHLHELLMNDPFSKQGVQHVVQVGVSRELTSTGEDAVSELLGVSRQQFQQLHEECDPMKLLPPQGLEPILKLKSEDIPKDSPLMSIHNVKSTRQFLELQTFSSIEISPGFTGPFDGQPEIQHPTKTPIPHYEVILSVIIFHPLKKRRDQEINILSCQNLTELRDKILCPNDYYIGHDFSEEQAAFKTLEEVLPHPPNPSHSAFFFVNNTFYSDLRHPASNNLRVREIIEWSRAENRIETSPRLDNFAMEDMASVKFEDLSFRIGYPYVFCHHNVCEHLMVFKDLRLLTPGRDSPYIEDYPKVVYRHKGQRRVCAVCDTNESTWVTYDDELATKSPCFFCQDCFKKLHYNRDGEKMCNFKAYPFIAPI